MPLRHILKNGADRKRKKAQYKITNWSEYNKSLKKRGVLSLYFPPGDLKSQFINEAPYVEGVSGQQRKYQRAYIELILIHYRLFGWGMRQITGYFEEFWGLKGLDIDVPSFGHLSDLFRTLPLRVQQFCSKVAKRIEGGEPVSLIFDSTGLRFDQASHWYETNYGKPCKQRPHRKMHLSMDPEMTIHAAEITEEDDSDPSMMDSLIPEEIANLIDKVLADGAYYSKERVEELSRKGILPVIPPPSNSVIHHQPHTTWHDQIVCYIQGKGSIHAFYQKYGYGLRELVEAQFSRLKRCLGNRLQTRHIESQKREGIIMANILNLWNTFGRCASVKIG